MSDAIANLMRSLNDRTTQPIAKVRLVKPVLKPAPAKPASTFDWTPEAVAKLIRMWKAGEKVETIRVELGLATQNQVIGKVHRLDLERRPNPIGGGFQGEKGKRHPKAARGVRPGEFWAFRDHRTVAEYDSAETEPEVPAEVPATDRDIIRFLVKDCGVTVFGPDDDQLYTLDQRQRRRLGMDALRKEANLWRERRGEPLFTQAEEKAA